MNQTLKTLVVLFISTISMFLGAESVTWARLPQRGLSDNEASSRAKQVQDIQYKLSLIIDPEKTAFSGETTITFRALNNSQELTLDFEDGHIDFLSVNGKAIESPQYNDLFITIPKSELKVGETNQLLIRYTHPFGNSGTGLYKFKDPEDGKYYVYTQFEPYDANKLLPCFDQPDLKAEFTLTVNAPADWVMAATTRETKVENKGMQKTWSFSQTQKISPYVFSIHGGPYQVWSDEFKSKTGNIPLRIFARKSLAKYVNTKEWFTVTKQGLEFYNGYFDYPYPFKKYDQLVVPDFNFGAMENVGNVTFSERYIKRYSPTIEEKEDLADTVLHEMAHMWFGDLVTMKWWNGLWLNESFATYMAAIAMQNATQFKRSWHTFFMGMKSWAYWEDQLVTSHPIEGPVADTESAFSTFDGITYGKGASSLKQLDYYLGGDRFRNGVRLYFKKHAYSNATLEDFFASIEEASHTKLTEWVDQWLKTAGLNETSTQLDCGPDGKIKKLSINQIAERSNPELKNTLRTHRTEIALYTKNNLIKKIPFAYSGVSSEVKEAAGLVCPDFIFTNYEDYDFAKISFDRKSLNAIEPFLLSQENALLRSMLWHTLWEMVRDAKYSVRDFSRLAFNALGKESDLKVLSSLRDNIGGRRSVSPSVTLYAPELIGKDYEDLCWTRFKAAKPSSDLQKYWFDFYTRIAKTEEALANLQNMLLGALKVNGFTLDQDRRWSIILALSASGAPKAKDLASKEALVDKSDKGVKGYIAATAAYPSLENKKEWINKITDIKSKESLGNLRTAMFAVFPATQLTMKEKFADTFYEKLNELITNKDQSYLENYSELLAPVSCNEKFTIRLNAFLEDNEKLNPIVVKNLKGALQEDQRCLKVRKLLGTVEHALQRASKPKKA